jgi:NADH-quinone oxidoreductase subunit L
VLLFVSFIGLTTAFIGAALALVQNDIKRVLAYSTISQLGFMMLALGSMGLAAGIFHLLAHGFFKALLFLCAGSVIHAMHEKQDMREMGGLRNRMPITYVAFFVAAFALIGIFPTSGFFSKDEVLVAVLEGRGALWYVAGLVAAGLTALYVARLLFMVFSGKPRCEEARTAHESPLLMLLPMLALMVPAAGLGLLALSWGDFGGFGTFLFFAPEGPHGFELRGWVFWPAFTLSYVGLLAGRFLFFRSEGLAPSIVQSRFPRLYRFLENGLYIDRAYQWIIDRVVLTFASATAWFDRHVVNNTGVDGPAKVTVWSSFLLRHHETGLVSNYVWAIAASATLILVVVTVAS